MAATNGAGGSSGLEPQPRAGHLGAVIDPEGSPVGAGHLLGAQELGDGDVQGGPTPPPTPAVSDILGMAPHTPLLPRAHLAHTRNAGDDGVLEIVKLLASLTEEEVDFVVIALGVAGGQALPQVG